MSSILDDSVTQAKEGTWTFQCPGVQGSKCGDDGVPFRSTEWPTREVAAARGLEHFNDHKLGEEIAAAIALALASTDDPDSVDRNVVREATIHASKYAPSQSLEDFRAQHGLTVDAETGVVTLKDLP
jgi:hypothetical protein